MVNSRLMMADLSNADEGALAMQRDLTRQDSVELLVVHLHAVRHSG